MTDRRTYSTDEVADLVRILERDGLPTCPRCDRPLDRKDVPPRSDVAYVRNRIWLTCGSCGRSAVIDRSRPGPD